MEKAGLNVGLMYENQGGGGSTMGAGEAAMPKGGEAPKGGGEQMMGMQLGMQLELMKAQKENIQADTTLKQVDAGKKAGVDTEEAKGRIANLAAQTENEGMKNVILNLEQQMNAIDLEVKDQTKTFNIAQAASNLEEAAEMKPE